MLKGNDNAGGCRRYILLHSFAFFADDVTDAIASVPEQFHAVANVYKGNHARNDGA
jgi:hypothetical protein